MIAVVDPASEVGIEIRAAAPPGVWSGFMEDDGAAVSHKRNRRREPRETRSDDMHAAGLSRCLHNKPWRNTSQSFSEFDTPTRSAGSRHPERCRAESIAR